MLRLGLTGGIGSGKSTVAKVFEAFGVPVFYSDTEAKRLYHLPEIKQELKRLFGLSIFTKQEVDKGKIAHLVFNDTEALTTLNALMHHRVRKAFDEWCQRQKSDIVANEAAILFETDAYKRFDHMVLVVADKVIRIKRVMTRDGCRAEHAAERMAKQWADERKIPLAQFIIYNNHEALIPQVWEILQALGRKNT